MAEYLSTLTSELGIPVVVFVMVFVMVSAWSMTWKLIALWKSARKNSIIWFIVLALFNTVEILPILYIFVFSKMKSSKPVVKKKSTKKKKR